VIPPATRSKEVRLRKSRFTETQIIAILHETDAGLKWAQEYLREYLEK